MNTMGFAIISLTVLFVFYNAVLDDVERLDVKIRISLTELLLVYLPLFSVLFCSFYRCISYYFFSIENVPWLFSFFENDVIASTYYLFGFCYLGYKRFRKKLSAASLKRWIVISWDLLTEYKIPELAYLFDKYHQQLAELATVGTVCDNKQNHKKRWYNIAYHLTRKRLGYFNIKYDTDICTEVAVSIAKLLRSSSFVKHLSMFYSMVTTKFLLIKFDGHERYKELLFRFADKLYDYAVRQD